MGQASEGGRGCEVGAQEKDSRKPRWGLLLMWEGGAVLPDSGVQGVGVDGLGMFLVLREEPGAGLRSAAVHF